MTPEFRVLKHQEIFVKEELGVGGVSHDKGITDKVREMRGYPTSYITGAGIQMRNDGGQHGMDLKKKKRERKGQDIEGRKPHDVTVLAFTECRVPATSLVSCSVQLQLSVLQRPMEFSSEDTIPWKLWCRLKKFTASDPCSIC